MPAGLAARDSYKSASSINSRPNQLLSSSGWQLTQTSNPYLRPDSTEFLKQPNTLVNSAPRILLPSQIKHRPIALTQIPLKQDQAKTRQTKQKLVCLNNRFIKTSSVGEGT